MERDARLHKSDVPEGFFDDADADAVARGLEAPSKRKERLLASSMTRSQVVSASRCHVVGNSRTVLRAMKVFWAHLVAAPSKREERFRAINAR